MEEQTAIKTTCPYCGVGCGVLAMLDEEGAAQIAGDPQHPANFGRLCSKGAALGETVDLEGRLLHPMVDGERASWEQALDTVAGRLRSIIDQHGPEAVAFYGSGQMLTEDYYVSNKLFKGFIGTPHVDTNSRLCMASAVVGHKRAFGSDTVPGNYADLESADLLIIAGANLAWCHPVLYQRVKAAKAERPDMRVVVIDPRRTDTCEIADLHLPLAPGTDVWLWNGLLSYLAVEGHTDYAFLEAHTEGFGAAIEAARASAPNVPAVAGQCDLPEADVLAFFRWFAATERTVSLYSQGVNQSSTGSDKVSSIINCHLLTGRIGRSGMGPFSITGQPNAMGGREVGGLANQLAAHMDYSAETVDRVRRFWQAPNLVSGPGNKAVDLFQAIERGEIRAVWIMATNPMVSLPDADRMRRALAGCELVVVSEAMACTDTTAVADVLLPAMAWGEKDGTVTNSERRISRQRPFLPPPGEAQPDWWALCKVALRLGFGDGFAYEKPAEIFREHAALSGFENNGSRDFDISALANLHDAGYEAMAPRQWPIRDGRDTGRLFADGGFFTESGKARLIPLTPRPPVNAPDTDYSLVLNTGRVRDHWHTMTRTGKSPRLSAHEVTPFLQMHPDDAARLDLGDGALARVHSHWGEALARVRLDDGQRPGSVFMPMHWNDQYALRGRVDAVVNPVTDPDSGEPEFKHTPVAVSPVEVAWQGFLLSREPLADPPACAWWAKARGNGFHRYELAGTESAEQMPDLARALLPGDGECLEMADPGRNVYRAARLVDGRLMGCLFMGAVTALPGRHWLAGLFTAEPVSTRNRMALLSGNPPPGQKDAGRNVCACFGVGENTIIEAIRKGCRTPEAVTRRCQAGGNCGSCVPEIRDLIGRHARPVNRRIA
ncbi:assimilatory nitrate reductase catalytic subunit [Natronocella acetinitrilica]|uniref:Assimilatory nitrate reductase catalytic subunit n=1 Tax=Natronocella acetinitrilica TaxID=414046 RepID=A0AAE3G577_9GAMM|nr:nitrate reductase [Natronocella acetinitrilica]MCP1675338.1 assimilatory nitrate reductase catalytic subunit [Natronocella acetinitrilica]